MSINNYYCPEDFAMVLGIDVRTLNYYRRRGLVVPHINDSDGKEYYNESHIKKMEQLIVMRYLRCSLEEMGDYVLDNPKGSFISNMMGLQKRIIHKQMEVLRKMEMAADDIIEKNKKGKVENEDYLRMIGLTAHRDIFDAPEGVAGDLIKRQRLHKYFSTNRQGWFRWLFDLSDITPGTAVLELGCGNGAFWLENSDRLPDYCSFGITDNSKEMQKATKVWLNNSDYRITADLAEAENIKYVDDLFNVVIANDVLPYCENIEAVISEVLRVGRDSVRFVCGVSGKNHMKELGLLLQEFDKRIELGHEDRALRFGIENGRKYLSKSFENVEFYRYEDSIEIGYYKPLLDYIMSCDGNQKIYIEGRYKEFKLFLKKKLKNVLHITKDLGVFVCYNKMRESLDKFKTK